MNILFETLKFTLQYLSKECFSSQRYIIIHKLYKIDVFLKVASKRNFVKAFKKSPYKMESVSIWKTYLPLDHTTIIIRRFKH